jgi:5-methylcytosine-specific restriction endonuclease McrA
MGNTPQAAAPPTRPSVPAPALQHSPENAAPRAPRVTPLGAPRQKYAATRCPRPSKPGSSPRHIPAAVKRAVRERDRDRCAYVSESGQRCSSLCRLEFDHIEPVSRGGDSTLENLRLLCRVHNQYAAERAFSAEFMAQKRAEARHTRPG